MTNPRVPFELSSDRRRLRPPQPGKPLIVHVVMNVEYWPFDQPMPRKTLSTPHGMDTVPDIPNWCWAEYGLRCGVPRLLALFESLQIPASVNLNSDVIVHYPTLAEAMLKAKWEFVGHGVLQRLLSREENEEAVIEAALARIGAFTGRKVRGWMGPGFAQTFHTADHLRKHGVEYNLDWIIDDLPCWMKTKHGPMICMPYAFELNDSLVYTVERQASADLLARVADTLTTYDGELANQPRILSLGLHPHQVGVPHRLPHLAKALRLLKERGDTIFMTGSEIADWYCSAEPPATVAAT
ncbi:MAG: polysaccharide deacetylase family protein [Betaproteobacteria bacterium]